MIESLQSLPKTRRHLIGVSGGCDSVVLLQALHQLGHRKLIVAHLNHRLRGRASGADATFVRRLARSLGLECCVGSCDVRALAKRSGRSLEHAARDARYTYFADLARKHRCRRVLLAHHADDQVETVLMNLFRGTGITGLSGMASENTRTIDGQALTLMRPLLNIWREELEAIAQREGWRYREDASNTNPQHLRNRVRHDAIPYLSRLFGRSDVRPAIARLAIQSEAENAFIDSLIAADATAETLQLTTLRKLPLALQRRLMHQWLQAREVSDLSFDLVERALTLIPPGSATVAKINLPKGKHLRRRAGVLFIV